MGGAWTASRTDGSSFPTGSRSRAGSSSGIGGVAARAGSRVTKAAGLAMGTGTGTGTEATGTPGMNTMVFGGSGAEAPNGTKALDLMFE